MAKPAVTASPSPEPFRAFFLLAGLDAILGAGSWFVPSFALQTYSIEFPTAAGWHRHALLLGTVPAIFAGFLLTALPRWTGMPAVSSSLSTFLVALWMMMRAVSLVSATAGLLTAALFVLALTAIAASQIIAADDRRDIKIVALLLTCTIGTMMTAGGFHMDLALRVALSSVLGLIMVLGGRAVPALTMAYFRTVGSASTVRRVEMLERIAATTATGALIAWIPAPMASLTGYACAVAAIAQAARLGQWKGWRTHRWSSVFALHVAYGWIVVGFALLAVHVLWPDGLARAAAVHAWTVGAIGSMSIAIMASMIRKHCGRPFSYSRPLAAAHAFINCACILRLLPELLKMRMATPMTFAGLAWIAAFGLFLVAFRRELLPPVGNRQQGSPHSSPPSL